MSNANVQKFIEKIADMYDNCDKKVLQKLWLELNGDGCQFLITRGVNKGNKCGKKTKRESDYCSRHGLMSEKPSQSRSRSVSPRALRSRSESPKCKDIGSRVLRKHAELNVLYHSDTGLVFRSAKDRVVVGIIRDNEIQDLNENDIETARKWSFEIDENGADVIAPTNQRQVCESALLNREIESAKRRTKDFSF